MSFPEKPRDSSHGVATLFERLKTDLLHARKTGDTFTTEALRFVVGEAERFAKGDRRDKKLRGQPLSDAETISLLKSTVLNLDAVITQAKNHGRETGGEVRQRHLFQEYLPAQLSDSELQDAVDEVFAGLQGPGRTLSLGDAMGELSRRYQGRYDGNLARRFVQARLVPAAAQA